MNKIFILIRICIYKTKRFISIIKTLLILKCNNVIYTNYRIVGTPLINTSAGGKITFGCNISMNNGVMANQIGFNTPCVFRAEGGSINIGENVGMSQTTMIAKGADITIGNNVKLGGGVKIYTTDFHSLDYLKRRNAKEDLNDRKCKPVTISDDCFIGAGTFIHKGATIGARSIVGAGSLVTKDIPADCIAAGNPCKVIKMINQ